MQVPTLEQLRTITQQEFLSLVVQAETEMGNEEPPANADELELLLLASQFGSAVYYAFRAKGINTFTELSKAKRGDPNIIKVVAKEALALAYPTYSTNGE